MKSRCDVILIQDTHDDGNITKSICKEFPGQWAFSNGTNLSGGVGIGIVNYGFQMTDDHEYLGDDGRLMGKVIKDDKHSFYIISA